MEGTNSFNRCISLKGIKSFEGEEMIWWIKVPSNVLSVNFSFVIKKMYEFIYNLYVPFSLMPYDNSGLGLRKTNGRIIGACLMLSSGFSLTL